MFRRSSGWVLDLLVWQLILSLLPGSPRHKYAVSAAPFESAGILPITYAYIGSGVDSLAAATATLFVRKLCCQRL